MQDRANRLKLVATLFVLTCSVGGALAQPTIYILKVAESQSSWTTPELLTVKLQDYLKTAASDLFLSTWK